MPHASHLLSAGSRIERVTGHRGWRDDPLYRARRALLVGEERLDEKASERLASLLALGDPNAEVAIAYRVN